MDAYADTRLMIVKALQRDRRVEAEAARLTRPAPRRPVRGHGEHETPAWPRRALAPFAR